MKKSMIRFLVTLTVAVILMSALAVPVSAVKITWATGTWKRNNIGWWYEYGDGSYAVNEWKKIDGKQYAFDKNGYMHTGWLEKDGEQYYFGSDGVMKYGWVTMNADYQCYFSSEYISLGQLHSEWRRKKDGWHCYIDGKECLGWVEVGFKWYYLDKRGVMLTGWQYIDGAWYYLKPDGMMQSHWFMYKGNWYYLGPDGAMRTGWARVGHQKWGNWGYFGDDGVMREGWLELDDEWYYIDPETGTRIQLQEHTINGKLYYFNEEGHMLRNGTYSRDNYRATADANGVVTKDIRYESIDFDVPRGWTRLPDSIPTGSIHTRHIHVARQGEETSGSSRPGHIQISISVMDTVDSSMTFDNFWAEHSEPILNSIGSGHTNPTVLTAQKRPDLGTDVMELELQSEDMPATMKVDAGYVPAYFVRDGDVRVIIKANTLPEQREEIKKVLEQIAGTIEIIR